VAVDRPRPGADEIAYLLFTSGSTGRPKAVMVSHGNATHFVEMAVRRYRIDPEDRLSQTFDLTFDLSVFDMFVAWTAGACLCCPSEGQKILPATYILGDRLSVWFSVPSIGLSMSRLRMLRPDQYPGLRLVLFCGEALPVEVAEAWQRAAPNAIIENLYGPTELTVACTAYTWRPDASAAESVRGVVPIGEPLPGMQALVVDEHCQEVSPGEDGELLMTGPQLSLGYLEDPVRTMAAFVQPPGRKDVYYRTGDRVRRPAQAGEPMHFLGRFDGQVKVRGHRVEVGEVEAALRERPGVDGAVVLPWPVTAAGADGLVAFVSGRVLDPDDLERSVRERLPTYMHPSAVHVLSEFPLNQNGKVDRRALASRLGDA
jgi:amino acid adenylation domain-containing protein